MTGTGTQDNPWLIYTVDDFMSLNNKTGYAKLNNNIDFNDHATHKFGVKFIADSEGLHFDGDGKQIRNLVFKDYNGSLSGSALNLGWINNVNFVNMVCLSCQDTSGNYPLINGKYENMHNSYNMFLTTPVNGAGGFKVYIPRYMKECTWNLSCKGLSNAINLGNIKIERTHINMDVNFVTVTKEPIFTSTNFDTCLITGKASVNTGAGMFNGGTVKDCVLNFDVTGVDDLNLTILNSPTFSGTNIVNKDRTKLNNSYTNNVKVLTDEQMKNTSYLQSIGFPVVEV